MRVSHRITTFLDLGKEKALTGFPPTLVCFFIWSTGCAARGCFSPMQGGIMRSRPSLTVYMIAGIDLGIVRHCATPFKGSIRARAQMTPNIAE